MPRTVCSNSDGHADILPPATPAPRRNEELGPLLIKQRTLVQALCDQPGLADAMALNSELADALVKTPVLVQVITSNPDVSCGLGE